MSAPASILAIETSCDETAVARFDPAHGVTAEWVHSQAAVHELHGGVVPDLAAREHLRNLPLLLARLRERDWDRRPDLIAVTQGPGLAPCLALGVAAAKALALQLGATPVGINHLRAHAWSPFMPLHAEAPAEFSRRFEGLLPHLGLIASGGHTLLVALETGGRLRRLASTLDDAAGEALDKGAKLLGLGYPGGPLIEEMAARGRRDAFSFPRGMSGRGGLEFSFSGVKTSLRYTIEKMTTEEARLRAEDLCASYQQAVVDALAQRVHSALSAGRYRSFGLSGGVARNVVLRLALEREAREAGAAFLAVEPRHAGDNAAMIGFAAWADPAGCVRAGLDLRIEPSQAVA